MYAAAMLLFCLLECFNAANLYLGSRSSSGGRAGLPKALMQEGLLPVLKGGRGANRGE